MCIHPEGGIKSIDHWWYLIQMSRTLYYLTAPREARNSQFSTPRSLPVNFNHSHFSLIPRPHPQEGKGLGTLELFLGLVHHHMTACALIQIYANNPMIAELAEPRIGSNVTRPFPHVRSGVWEQGCSHLHLHNIEEKGLSWHLKNFNSVATCTPLDLNFMQLKPHNEGSNLMDWANFQ